MWLIASVVLGLALAQPGSRQADLEERIQAAHQILNSPAWTRERGSGDLEGYFEVVSPVLELSKTLSEREDKIAVPQTELAAYLTGLVESPHVDLAIMPRVVFAGALLESRQVRAQIVFAAYRRGNVVIFQHALTDPLSPQDAERALDEFEVAFAKGGFAGSSDRDFWLAAMVGDQNVSERFDHLAEIIAESTDESSRMNFQFSANLDRAHSLLGARNSPKTLTQWVQDTFKENPFQESTFWALQEVGRIDPAGVPILIARLHALARERISHITDPNRHITMLALLLNRIEAWATESGFLEPGAWGNLDQYVPKFIVD